MCIEYRRPYNRWDQEECTHSTFITIVPCKTVEKSDNPEEFCPESKRETVIVAKPHTERCQVCPIGPARFWR